MTVDADVVVVGAGLNGLTAAAYLAAAGRSVVVLERGNRIGGAAVSIPVFAGHDVLVSRYADRIGHLPERIVADLGLDVPLVSLASTVFSPRADNPRIGLLWDASDTSATEESAERVGEPGTAAELTGFTARAMELATALQPTLTEPLPTRNEVRSRLSEETWSSFCESPLDNIVRHDIRGDTARGTAVAEALMESSAGGGDASLETNRLFLKTLMTRGFSNGRIPRGGMSELAGALARSALSHGVDIVTDADVIRIDAVGRAPVMVTYLRDGQSQHLTARHVVADVSPKVLEGLQGGSGVSGPIAGTLVKVNVLLTGLPRLADPTVSSEQALAGVVRVNSGWELLHDAHDQVHQGRTPVNLPCAVTSPSLTDPSVLGQLGRRQGLHTLAVLAGPFARDARKAGRTSAPQDDIAAAVMRSLNSVLTEPLEELIARDSEGRPCVDVVTVDDIDTGLTMPGGRSSLGVATWPFANEADDLSTPAGRWGVATTSERVVRCDALVRGVGGVTCVAGYSAAMAVLESEA